MRPVWAARRIASIALLHQVIPDHNLDFDLGQKIDDVFGTAVELGMTLLSAEALGLGYGYALQSDFLKRFLDLVELERLDDGFYFFHRAPPGISNSGPQICFPTARMRAVLVDRPSSNQPVTLENGR